MAISDVPILNPVSWERMNEGIEKVRARLLRASTALARMNVPYAIVGGNAVAAWVSRVDESVVRATRDVDILLRRDDFGQAIEALEQSGFIHRTAKMLGQRGRIEMFLDGPDAKARDALHIIFANEKVKEDSLEPSPSVEESEATVGFQLLNLDALVTMKLTSYRDKDRVHLRDMIEIGQLNESFLDRVPESLRSRLQALLSDPEG